jgi:sugar phosphate isomerase/epimerase
MKFPRNFFRVQHTDPVLLPKKIDELIELGLGLELRDFILPALLDSSKDLALWVEAYREISKGKLSFSIHGPVIDLNLGSVDEKIRQISIERIIQAIKVVEELSAEFLIVHTGYDHRFLNNKDRFESWIERSLESYSWIFNKIHIPKHLRAICVENSPEESLNTYWVYLQALTNKFVVGIPIRACIDYDHLLVKEKGLISQCLKNPIVVYLHLPWKKRISYTICQNLPKHYLQSICFEGELGNKVRRKLQKLTTNDKISCSLLDLRSS